MISTFHAAYSFSAVMLSFSRAFAVGAGFLMCSRASASAAQDTPLRLAPAVDHVVAAFQRYPLVAFSEPRHGAGGTRELIRAILQHPGFAGTVNDIVVEFGNARYQDVADRYVAGSAVPQDEVRQIWENTTIVSGIWTAPMYAGVLADVRELNARLPANRRIRVLLGDPPIDWTKVRSPADEDMNDWRDAHFAWVVEEHVLKKNRRALLWVGGAHVSRQVLFPESLIHLLDRRFSGKTFVVIALERKGVSDAVARRLGVWPSLMAAPVRGTWLGHLDARSAGLLLSHGTVEQNIDVAIFWEFPQRQPDEVASIEPDSRFAVELQRRQELSRATVAFRGAAIRFRPQTAAISEQSNTSLGEVLAELKRDTSLTLVVKAFTDARESHPDSLSVERARAVVQWLTQHGIAARRLEPRGCAAARALWIGDSERQRAANRRAELVRAGPLAACTPPTSFEFR